MGIMKQIIRRFQDIQSERGDALLIGVILAVIIVSLTGLAVANIITAANTGAVGATMSQQARWYAEIKANEINSISYSNLSSVAETRSQIAGTDYDREVIVDSEKALEHSIKSRHVTVNIYKSKSSVPLGSVALQLTDKDGSKEPHGSQIFKESGFFIVPDNVGAVYVTMAGGGGGSGGNTYFTWTEEDRYDGTVTKSTSGTGGVGGYGACVLRKKITVTPGETISVVIGRGGSCGSTISDRYRWYNWIQAGNGVSGTASSFGNYLTCAAGTAGTGSQSGRYSNTNGVDGKNGGTVEYGVSERLTTFGAYSGKGGRGDGQDGGCLVEW